MIVTAGKGGAVLSESFVFHRYLSIISFSTLGFPFELSGHPISWLSPLFLILLY